MISLTKHCSYSEPRISQLKEPAAKTLICLSLSACLLVGCSVAIGTSNKNVQPTPLLGPSKTFANKQCVQLPDEHLEFGEVTDSDIEQWFGLEKLITVNNTQFLATNIGQSGKSYLRQRLSPTKKGSTRASARGELPPAATYRLSQSFYLEPGFDWGSKNEGGKIGFGLGGNTAPTGGMLDRDGFSARMMWRGKRDGTARFSLYVYSSDRSQNLPYGDDYIIEDYSIPIGEWVNVTMEVTANSTIDEPDGSFKVWINKKLKLDQKNIHWQAQGLEPAVDRLLYATFHGGGDSSWSPSSTVYARTSSICWHS